MGEDASDYQLLGYVLASTYRTKIALMLSSQAATPKQMAKITNLRIGHVSNVLKGLVNKGLIECVNAEAKRGRIYRLTQKGKCICELMKKLGLNKTS
jgi:DNA-binding MarR family transcriptional regulator